MDCQDCITEPAERKKGQHLQREERGAIQHKSAGTVIFDGNGGTTKSDSKYYIEERVFGGNLILRDRSETTMFQQDGRSSAGTATMPTAAGKRMRLRPFQRLSSGIIWLKRSIRFLPSGRRTPPDTSEQPSEPAVPAVPSHPTTPDGSDSYELPFVDVPENAYYCDAVAWAVVNGITKGQSETKFAPDKICTRVEMVTSLWRAKGSPEPTASDNPFTDILQESYYYDAVLWTLENNITTGTSETAFSPDDKVSRSEAVTFLWRCAGKPAAEEMLFADVDDGTYYAEAVRWATAGDIANGTGEGAFAPDTKCSRSQIVTFLYRSRE